MDNLGYEPYVPQLRESATSRPEYQLHYRDPQTGEEHTVGSDSVSVWNQRKLLADAGYQVAVARRQVTISAWEIVERAA
ncbi:hypothetical protein [Nocardia ignorata]|uniref:Uncharacterized protein n=1 Tax=Nocardia ignorata TaxID=145285 RepID=A0A4R6NZ42_NOCIG|nr:hypothetical protein [Nocardia ignorata]TDP29813.1 hypothetical protein DFR75_11281 [Nocardia ignorata]